MDETEYVAFIADLPGSYESSMQLEKTMEQLIKDYENQEQHRMLEDHAQLRVHDRQSYYEESDRITRNLRLNYRNCVSE